MKVYSKQSGKEPLPGSAGYSRITLQIALAPRSRFRALWSKVISVPGRPSSPYSAMPLWRPTTKDLIANNPFSLQQEITMSDSKTASAASSEQQKQPGRQSEMSPQPEIIWDSYKGSDKLK